MRTQMISSARGQTAIEYLLLLGVVAFIMFMAFAKGGFMTQVQDTSKEHFDTIANVILGDNPKPIQGGWCEWSACSGGKQYRTCECPAPAFGGSCPGESEKGCS
jgi:Flp pilus assembly pilin Flp